MAKIAGRPAPSTTSGNIDGDDPRLRAAIILWIDIAVMPVALILAPK
jgi:hypothetical protein